MLELAQCRVSSDETERLPSENGDEEQQDELPIAATTVQAASDPAP